jgi:hypothetical protein
VSKVAVLAGGSSIERQVSLYGALTGEQPLPGRDEAVTEVETDENVVPFRKTGEAGSG